IQFVVEHRVDCLCRTEHEQRVAVGGRAHDGLGGDVGASARPVLDDERLAEPLRQPLTHEAGGEGGWAASGKGDDHPHRPRRIGLRASETGDGRQRGSANGQADLRLIDHTNLSVGPSSTVRLDKFVYDPKKGSGSVAIDATKGAFRFVTGSQNKSGYKVKTPYGVIGTRG